MYNRKFHNNIFQKIPFGCPDLQFYRPLALFCLFGVKIEKPNLIFAIKNNSNRF